MNLLEVKGLKSGYGKVSVLFGIDIYIRKRRNDLNSWVKWRRQNDPYAYNSRSNTGD